MGAAQGCGHRYGHPNKLETAPRAAWPWGTFNWCKIVDLLPEHTRSGRPRHVHLIHECNTLTRGTAQVHTHVYNHTYTHIA